MWYTSGIANLAKSVINRYKLEWYVSCTVNANDLEGIGIASLAKSAMYRYRLVSYVSCIEPKVYKHKGVYAQKFTSKGFAKKTPMICSQNVGCYK